MTTPAPVRDAILARCARGMSYLAIAREVAASYATVKRIGNAAGHRRPVGRPSRIASEKRRQEPHRASPAADVASAGTSGPPEPIGAVRASYGLQEGQSP